MSLTMSQPGISGAATAPPPNGSVDPRALAKTFMPPPPKPGAAHKAKLSKWAKEPNLADNVDETITDEVLEKLAARVKTDYDLDERTRTEYLKNYRKWLDFALQIAMEKTYPWPDASNIIYPLITAAAIQFAARAYPAIIRDSGVVKGTVIGSDDGKVATNPADGEAITGPSGPYIAEKAGDKQTRANKIGAHMSYQLLIEQEEWEPQTDRMLILLPIVGTMFRKSYFDPQLGRNVSETIDATKLCVDYHAKSFETAPRKTELIELYPWEVVERVRAGLFLDYGDDDVGYGIDSQGTGEEAQQDQTDPDAKVTFLEQHRRYDLDGDGYAEPYIVTVARDSGKLARIKACFEDEGIKWTDAGDVERIQHIEYYTPYPFIPSPESKIYALGFGHLLFPINESVNTTLNQMFDAGHQQIVGGGFINSGLSINTGSLRFQMGEYKPVQSIGGNIRDQVFPIPFPGPNPVLMSLLQFLVEAGERIASVKDVMVGDMPGDNTSGITTLAVIEQGLKVFSAIYKRIHRSLGYEFKKLYRLNRLYLEDSHAYQHGGDWSEISREDYEKGSGVVPISDPQMVTDMQRLGRAQFMLQFKDDPRVDGAKIIQDAFAAAMIAKPESYMNKNPPQPPPEVALKSRELDLRGQKDQGELQLKSFHGRAQVVKDIANAEFLLAQARALDNQRDLSWVQHELERIKVAFDGFSAVHEATNNYAQTQAALQQPAGGDSGS